MNKVAQQPILAFVAALAAVGALSVMDAVMKGLVIALGIFAVSVWRALVNLVIAAALYLPRRLPWPSRATLRIHVARAVLVTIMAVLFFWGIARVPLAQAIALTFIAPLIALLLAVLFLGERIGPRSIGGSAAAFAGVLVIVLGQATTDLAREALIGSAAILASALCYAGNIVMMRHQALAARPLEINFFQAATVMGIWIAVIAIFGMPAIPVGQWDWIIIASLLSTAGGLMFAWSYARAQASYLAVTEYSAFLWAAALGWLIFDEHVTGYTLGGAALIVGGCLLASRRRPAVMPEIKATA
ncbi:MAG TPA: DMT family transporter [Sphingomicrobium sp.]|nr:DMT family transporter [Sphingomicrobium sp.]